jgi:ADP-ribose pyrophosphatase YjhB (NUDIX family)
MIHNKLIKRIIRETIEENFPMPNGTVVPYTNSIYDTNSKRVNGSVNINGRDRWISRSNNVHLFLYCKDENGEWCLLASQRGRSGKWNAVAGFLDYYESLEKAAARECFEETGVKVDPTKLKCVNTKSFVNKLNAQSQDVITTFVGILKGITKNYPTSMANAEDGEVTDVKWIPLSQIQDYPWALGHDKKALQWANVFLKNNIGKKDDDYNTIINTLSAMVNNGKITQDSYKEVVKAIELYLK